MMGNPVHHNELNTEKAFSKQAAVFDEIYSRDEIIRYKRQRVWEHTERFLSPSSHILELNAGTGEDAIHFARQGHFVHATDISWGMQQKLVQKVKDNKLEKQISNELCSYTELLNLQNEGPYDYIFSNFAGLNCTGRLEKVLYSFSYLLKPGGHVTLVVLPKFCLWEFLLLFRGKFKTAFRRFTGRKGASAQIEGEKFRCWYYNSSFIKKQLKDSFTVVAQEGLCTIVPPSYIDGFAPKHPKLYKYLQQKENKLKSRWPWRAWGDYYIITLQKN
jgi:ubiquinone/menaquinone biosynthesis C-methylase UbiE